MLTNVPDSIHAIEVARLYGRRWSIETHINRVKHVMQTDPNEIQLNPVLKINTGSEVKAISLSRNGRILAATCFDDEEGLIFVFRNFSEEDFDVETVSYLSDWCDKKVTGSELPFKQTFRRGFTRTPLVH